MATVDESVLGEVGPGGDHRAVDLGLPALRASGRLIVTVGDRSASSYEDDSLRRPREARQGRSAVDDGRGSL